MLVFCQTPSCLTLCRLADSSRQRTCTWNLKMPHNRVKSTPIGIVTALVLLAIGTAWLISKAVQFSLQGIFSLTRNLVKERINQHKKSENNPEPFCLSMFGLIIMAQGIRGKIMFISLSGSLTALLKLSFQMILT